MARGKKARYAGGGSFCSLMMCDALAPDRLARKAHTTDPQTVAPFHLPQSASQTSLSSGHQKRKYVGIILKYSGLNHKRMSKVLEIAWKRVPESGIEGMNINDFIAYLDELYRVYKPLIGSDPVYRNRAEVYVYLRDRMGAQTVGSAMEILRGRKLDHRIVEMWIDEALFDGMNCEAIEAGYPELVPQIERVMRKRRGRA